MGEAAQYGTGAAMARSSHSSPRTRGGAGSEDERARPPPGQSDAARVGRAIRFLVEHQEEQPSLERTAAEVGLSGFHFQRLFLRWAGVSPKRFLQFLTAGRAKELLRESRSLLDTSGAIGLSGTGRLHDLFLSVETMTPGEFKARARGLVVEWGELETRLGTALVATVGGRAAFVGFFSEGEGADGPGSTAGGREAAHLDLRNRFPEATFVERPQAVDALGALLRARLDGKPGAPVGLLLKGTPLQLKVWEALLRIPSGCAVSYGDVARLAGAPAAVRAVASAVGDNHLSVLIPCHRVLRSTGAFGGYHWGLSRKAALLGREQLFANAAFT
jgi:AraC family transcriptional regulator, regulatory protein of adaptative response / methylated-DNA-[protein]-cysteine methyltransferase